MLGLLLILAVLVWSFNLFYIPSGSGGQVSGGPSTLVVVAKQDYVYARVELVIQPFIIGNQYVSITFPNGTVRDITTNTKIDIVLPNTVYYTYTGWSAGAPECIASGSSGPGSGSQLHGCVTLAPGTSNQGCNTSPSQPLCVSLLLVANATASYASEFAPANGIHAFQYLINGTAGVNVAVQSWGVIL